MRINAKLISVCSKWRRTGLFYYVCVKTPKTLISCACYQYADSEEYHRTPKHWQNVMLYFWTRQAPKITLFTDRNVKRNRGISDILSCPTLYKQYILCVCVLNMGVDHNNVKAYSCLQCYAWLTIDIPN